MRLFLLSIIIILSTGIAHAQRACSTAGYTLPDLAKGSNAPGPDKIITIPVVVHILYNQTTENISDLQILSQLEALNADFSRKNTDFIKVPGVFAERAANVNIQFELAKTDPQGRSTSGIIRKKTSRIMWTDDNKIKASANGGSTGWDARQYLNVWVCNTVPGLSGYASFPGGDPALDGIVIRYDAFGTSGQVVAPYNKGRTMTHEVGHWLGLKHLWGDGPCGDDGIEDTPKQRGGNSGTPSFPRLTPCNGTAEGEMFMNFMDFTNDEAMGMFTNGQKEVMRAQFDINGKRAGLLQSKGLEQSWNTAMVATVATPTTTSKLVNIYPNPAQSGKINLTVNQNMGINGMHFAIMASNGQILKTGHMQTNQQEVDIRSLHPGVYQVRFTDASVTLFSKFVVQ
jgi:hypothetical protein